MNIFVLDKDLDKCARYHVDKHVIKMILEAAQMLCTTAWIDEILSFVPRRLDKHERETLTQKTAEARKLRIEERHIGYLPAMVNHPCTISTRSSLDNFLWLQCYANALNDEYGYRYNGKTHKSIEIVNALPDPKHLPLVGHETFAQAMPDQYKTDDTVTAYRNYYNGEKRSFASWKFREPPEWWKVE